MTSSSIRWLSDISLGDADQVGGKAANLGELTAAGFPVPPGFVVTADAYADAMAANAVFEGLRRLTNGAAAIEQKALLEISNHARDSIRGAGIPIALRDDIEDAVRELDGSSSGEPLSVVVRSSAIGEDAGDTSFAGMNETFTNLTTLEEILDGVVECWASLYGERVISYRAQHGLTADPKIAVVIQSMIDSQRSGVMFTADPASGDQKLPSGVQDHPRQRGA
jgi:pyruvate,water dikinase